MKLLEKLKNTFFEEEYIEVDEPEVKEQVVAKKVEPKEIKKEVKREVHEIPVEKKEPVVSQETVNYSDSKLVNGDSKLPYFEDDDFIEEEVIKPVSEPPKKIYGGTPDKLYSSINNHTTSSSKPYGTPVKESFKPTPIISPIYGILDKNYHKDEVIDRKDKPASYVSRKNADLDSVRRKAYGEINPIEDMPINDDKKNEIENDDNQLEDNLLYDMTNDSSAPSVDKVTIADAEEYFNDLGLEYNIDYKDSRYEKATGRRTSSNNSDKTDEDTKKEDSDDANLDDNLFDLIDSMYEDGE